MSAYEIIYNDTLEKITGLKEKGWAFDFKGMDLSDLLLSEIISIMRSSHNPSVPGIFFKMQFALKYLIERIAFNWIKRSRKGYVLVFITSLNHWQNARSVVKYLIGRNISVEILTTKAPLLKLIRKMGYRVAYVKGASYRHSEWEYKKNGRKESICQIIESFIPFIDFLYDRLSLILKRDKPAFVLIGNDLVYEGRLLARLANMFNIPTGSIQHGSISRINPRHAGGIVDYFFVFGEQAASELKYLRKSSVGIMISGWPQKKSIYGEIEKCSRVDKWGDGYVAVTLSGPGHSTSVRHHKMIIDLLIRFQEETNLNYCIKLHPKDAPENYTGLNPGKTMILSNRKMGEDYMTYWGILKQSLFIITGSSTSALDASLIGKPVVTIDLLNEYSDVNFIKDGLTLHSTKYGELTNHFRALSSMNFEVDSKIKDIISRYYYRYSDDNYDPAFFISEEIIKNASRNAHFIFPVIREI